MTFLESLVLHSPALCVATPLLSAFLLPLVSRIYPKVRDIFAFIMCIMTSCFVGLLAVDVLSHGPRIYVFGAQDIDTPLVRILFEVDAMGIFMAIITMMLACIAVIYSWSFLHREDGLDKYYTLLLLVVASAIGMQLTGDLFNFFVFLEISCIASCALIAFWIAEDEALEAALKYIVVSSIAALFVLFAIGIFYGQYNALNIAVLASILQLSFLDKISLVILLVSLGLKAGLAPMHMWLPDSYGRAPPSVVLIIMTVTLASFYGILRVVFTLYGNVLANSLRFSLPAHVVIGWVLIVLALVSILIGVIMALVQTDLLRLIGYTSVAEIGYIVLAFGTSVAALGTPYGTVALQGAVLHIFNDAMVIGLLFLIGGAIFYSTKKRSLDELGGLARSMKFTTIFFLVGMLAVSGMPPLNGFVSKFLIYESVFQLNPLLSIIALLGSIVLLAVFVKVLYAAFFGPQMPSFTDVKEVPQSMVLAMGLLAGCAVVIGLFPNLFLDILVKPAAGALLDHAGYINMVIGGL